MALNVAAELLVASLDASAEADATEEGEEESESRALDEPERLTRGLPDDDNVRAALLVVDAAAVDDADKDGDEVEDTEPRAELERAGEDEALTDALAGLDADALVVGNEYVGIEETDGWPDALPNSVADALREVLRDS